jgi:hypothetical protein
MVSISPTFRMPEGAANRRGDGGVQSIAEILPAVLARLLPPETIALGEFRRSHETTPLSWRTYETACA